MGRMPDLAIRSDLPELMDDRSLNGHVLSQALGQLRWINRLLGASWPILEGVTRLWAKAGRPPQLSILDVGAGSGDVNRLLLRWATWRRVRLHITLLDIHPETCAVAAACYRDEPRIDIIQGDVGRLAVRQVDIVTASLFLHHFPSNALPDVCNALLHAARLGIVINDLHRHEVAWIFIWLATRLLSQNRMIRHDAPLSVWRGFRATDLDWLRSQPGLTDLVYVWRPVFRYLIIIPR